MTTGKSYFQKYDKQAIPLIATFCVFIIEKRKKK